VGPPAPRPTRGTWGRTLPARLLRCAASPQAVCGPGPLWGPFCALRVPPCAGAPAPARVRSGAARPGPLRGRGPAFPALASLPAPAPRARPPGSPARGLGGAPAPPPRPFSRWPRCASALPSLRCGLPVVALAPARARLGRFAGSPPGPPGPARFAASGAAPSRPGACAALRAACWWPPAPGAFGCARSACGPLAASGGGFLRRGLLRRPRCLGGAADPRDASLDALEPCLPRRATQSVVGQVLPPLPPAPAPPLGASGSAWPVGASPRSGSRFSRPCRGPPCALRARPCAPIPARFTVRKL